MSMIRKRSLDKNKSALRKTTQQNTQDTSQSTTSFAQLIQTLKWYIQQLQTAPLDQMHKSVSDLLNGIIQSKKAVLVAQRLPGYCQCFNLMAKYLIHVKLKGGDPIDQECVLALSVFRGIVDEINKFTQDEKNDEIVKQSNIVVVLINVLQTMVASLQTQSQKSEKRTNKLMRKNSLKKIQQLPTIRPSSRGKLSSLSKTASKLSKAQILLPQIKLQQKPSENSSVSLQETVLKLFAILKNLSANKHIRRQLLKQQYLRLFNRYISIWNDKNLSQYGNSLMVQITSAYRHLAADDKAYKIFLSSNCIQVWSKAIEMFPTSNDIIFNLLRIFSKISSYSQCCEKLNEKKLCLKTLGTFFKVYRSNIHIIIRVAFIFANMTSYLSDIRTQLYFDFAAWPDVYGCFVHYADSELKGKSQIEKMGVSMAAWDYQAMKKQSDIQALIKIIRLIANIFTVSNIGQDVYINDSKSYRDLVFKLTSLLERLNITQHADLITCVLSCLTNVLYYDRQVLLANTQYKHAKNQLIGILVNFVVQIDNEQICCESLRVLSNLTRMKQYNKAIIEAKIHQALLILLDSTSKQIVYYSLGTILNLLIDQQFRNEYSQPIINSILEILSACQSEDFDLVGVALKVLSTIMNGHLDPKLLTQIQNALVNLGNNCDRIIIGQSKKVQITSVQQSRALINVLLNNMPEQKYICPFKNCGRKFADEQKLKQHTSRRHKAL